ncbi:MAG: hypothetical protein ACJ748_09910 [Flavisolibacter sp.]
MKNLIFVLVFAAIGVTVKGQYGNTSKTMIWSLGIKPSIPFGEFSSYSSFGLGGNIQAEIRPHRVGFTLNAGYIDYFGKTTNGYKYSDFKYIPVMGGIKYYMGTTSFLHGQLGPGFGMDGIGTSFWYGAGIGLDLGKSIDAELGYMGWKQSLINNNYNNSTTTGTYNTGGTGGTGGGGGGYGGHYPTIDLRIGIKF